MDKVMTYAFMAVGRTTSMVHTVTERVLMYVYLQSYLSRVPISLPCPALEAMYTRKALPVPIEV